MMKQLSSSLEVGDGESDRLVLRVRNRDADLLDAHLLRGGLGFSVQLCLVSR